MRISYAALETRLCGTVYACPEYRLISSRKFVRPDNCLEYLIPDDAATSVFLLCVYLLNLLNLLSFNISLLVALIRDINCTLSTAYPPVGVFTVVSFVMTGHGACS